MRLTSGTTIKSKLFGAGASRFGEVDVEVAGRFVLLSGRVPSEADKAEAERIAWSVSSVDEVANELVIDKFDMGRDVNDRWITEQVRARIISDSDVKGVNYNIQVYNGVVYMLGIAKSEDELRRAAEHASKVKGVQKVVSYVKMRDRVEPPTTQAGAQAEFEQAGAVQIAPSVETAAPIVPPDRPPTTRAQYGDPYAPGAAPPPGRTTTTTSACRARLCRRRSEARRSFPACGCADCSAGVGADAADRADKAHRREARCAKAASRPAGEAC